MRLLAIDTSATALSAAIVEEERLIGSFCLDTGKNHSLGLLPMLEALLANTQLTLSQMDAFAVTQGPGSFTGLRIGIATVKAWHDALHIPVIGVGSLAALGRAMDQPGLAVPVLDARRNEVYTTLCVDGVQQEKDQALSPLALCEKLSALPGPIAMAGDGLGPYFSLFQEKLGEKFRPVRPERRLNMAAAAGMLALAKAKAGQFTPAQELLPTYLRLSEAEEKRLAAQTKA